jgi:hypothetical protein
MRRLSAILLLAVFVASAFADDSAVPEPTQNPDAPYRLFRTQNIYTLLKLDTRTGQVWQVRWGTDDDHRVTLPINRTILLTAAMIEHSTILKPGRFTLTPTENIYTFMLLDQQDGRTWQIQWGDEKHRLIVAVE